MKIKIDDSLAIDVIFDYYPEEQPTLTYPGLKEDLFIENVTVVKGTVLDLILHLNNNSTEFIDSLNVLKNIVLTEIHKLK